jgi:hypothetical protein
MIFIIDKKFSFYHILKIEYSVILARYRLFWFLNYRSQYHDISMSSLNVTEDISRLFYVV